MNRKKPNKKIYCIYHSNDLDGICCGAIAKYYFEFFETYPIMIGYDYGQPVPEIEKGSEILLMDVSFDVKTMDALNKSCDLYWIDHHVSKIIEIANAGISINGSQVDGIAACILTWNFFFPNELVPEPIMMLGLYDVFEKIGTKWSWEKEIVPFQYGMRQYGLDNFPIATFLDEDNSSDFVLSKIEQGNNILSYLNIELNKICNKNSFEIKMNGWRCLCLNTNDFNTISFHGIYDPFKHDVMVAFAYTRDCWKVSFYSDKKEIDVSEFCQGMGGGGHRGAAGFTLNNINDLFLDL